MSIEGVLQRLTIFLSPAEPPGALAARQLGQTHDLATRKIGGEELGGTEAVKCRVATAEDTILAKLTWYRQGGEQSERQWADLRGILSVQGERLDETYLRKWAYHLGVADLLERLFGQRGNL